MPGRSRFTRSARPSIKQVDRLLSNAKLDLDDVFGAWVAFVVSSREEMVIALDWTEFEGDDHVTLRAHTATSHGRATPLVWRTVQKSKLRGTRTATEHAVIEMLHRWVDPKVRLTLLADRGFGDRKLYELLKLYGWDFVVRFKGNIIVEHDGTNKPAKEWIAPNGRATMLEDVRITDAGTPLAAVVVAHDRRMKEGWCLATSLDTKTALRAEVHDRGELSRCEGFPLWPRPQRDAHSRRRSTRPTPVARRYGDRVAHAPRRRRREDRPASDAQREHRREAHASVFRQGLMLWDRIPNEREDRLVMLIQAFDEIVREHALFRTAFGIM